MTDFSTKLTVRGTKSDYRKVLEILRYYAEDSRERESDHVFWYFDRKVCWFEDSELKSYVKRGVMQVSLCGPYGSVDQMDPYGGVISIVFQKIADAIPESSFVGEMSGFAGDCDVSIKAELRDGLLYYRQREDSGSNVMEDEEAVDAISEDGDEPAEEWDEVYEPKTQKWIPYQRYFSEAELKEFTFTIVLTDQAGGTFQTVIPIAFDSREDELEDSLWVYAYPDEYLAADTVESFLKLLLKGYQEQVERQKKLPGFDVWQKRWGRRADAWESKIADFQKELSADIGDHALSNAELRLVFEESKSRRILDWMNPTLAKKVCHATEQNRKKYIEEFENYLTNFSPRFRRWSWLCYSRQSMQQNKGADGKASSAMAEDQYYRYSGRLVWNHAAESIEDFARLLCSKEAPGEYFFQQLLVNFETGSVKDTVIYAPGYGRGERDPFRDT